MSEEAKVTSFEEVIIEGDPSFNSYVSSDPSFVINSPSTESYPEEHLISIPHQSSEPYHSFSESEDLKPKSEGFDNGWIKSWVGNLVWRAMNLAGIGEYGSPVAIAKATASRIAVAVAATNLVIDAGKYIIAEKMKHPDSTLADVFKTYCQDPQGLRKTAKEMVVVGLSVVGWTTGYTFMMEAFSSQKILDLVMRALASGGASGVMSGVGTKLTGQDLNASLRAGLQALAEGFVWSMVADKNISNIIDKQVSYNALGLITDSVAVASTAAAAFELTGRSYQFFSSQCVNKRIKKQTQEKEKESSNSLQQPLVIREESDESIQSEPALTSR